MARKPEESTQPVVTTLPLPSSESVLVIDLPDGQKLLVGKMTHGTVIEVATWRGTGRPDSRTNRLMLGMSSGENESAAVTSPSDEELVVDKRSVKYWIWFATQLIKSAIAHVSKTFESIIGKFKKPDKSPNSIHPKETVEDDVQAWLDNIKKRSSESIAEKSVPKASSGIKKSPSTSRKAVKKPAKKPAKKANSRSKA